MSSGSTPRIFLSPPHMGGEELEMVLEAFDSNYIAPAGPHITAFEREMEEYLGIAGHGHCVALSSGTAALHIALRLCGVSTGDAVPCSDLTFIGSVGPVRYLGGLPVFVETLRDSWNLDPGRVALFLREEAKRGRPVKAVIAVHLFGQPADIAPLAEACAEYGAELIEDAAESLGSLYHGRHTGTFGRFGILSFNGNKIITTSGGGMLICAREEDARAARFLATQARDDAPHYQHSVIGYNYRLSNLCAAVGRGQLRVLQDRVRRRREIFEIYRHELSSLEAAGRIVFQPEPEDTCSNRWLTCLAFTGPRDAAHTLREAVLTALEDENIESRPVWKPMHIQPVFSRAPFLGPEADSVGEDLFLRGLCLPSGTALTGQDINRISSIIIKITGGY